jgi:hypothetical protein
MSYFNMVSHNPPAIMVSIQCAKKNPDGMKGESFPSFHAFKGERLMGRYQLEYQEHETVLRIHHLGAILGSFELYFHRCAV